MCTSHLASRASSFHVNSFHGYQSLVPEYSNKQRSGSNNPGAYVSVVTKANEHISKFSRLTGIRQVSQPSELLLNIFLSEQDLQSPQLRGSASLYQLNVLVHLSALQTALDSSLDLIPIFTLSQFMAQSSNLQAYDSTIEYRLCSTVFILKLD